jgi:Tfp pilus assembly pilus retraction ATPase PilT
MTTLYEAKGQARRLSEYLASLDLSLNHSQALEAIARSRGAQSWNAFSSEAALAESVSAQAADSSRPPGDSEFVTFEGIVRHARAHEYGAVHISARHNDITLSQRVRGILHPLARLGSADALALGLNMSTGFKNPSRVGFKTARKVENIEVEVNSIPVVGGFEMVLNFPRLPQLHELGLTPLRAWSRLVKAGHGLILVGGNTDTARDIICATVGAQIMHDSELNRHILEDRSWVGIPTHERNPGDHRNAIRMALRTDVQVILSEIRTAESLNELLMAAETGHLVIATLQSSPDPVKVLQRLAGLVPAEEKAPVLARLQSALTAILSQQSVHPRCEFCDGDGCNHCYGTGRGLAELLSTLWVSDGPGTKCVTHLLEGSMHYRTLADDLAVKENLGLRFDEDVLKSL